MRDPGLRVGRRRLWLGVGIAMVIAAGLASRRFPFLVPDVLGKYPGDAFWALMVFLGSALMVPGARTGRLALAALAVCFAVEFSQLYRIPWLDSLRATTPGHLVLGSAFGWGDLVAYGVGVALGAMGDWLWMRGSRDRDTG